MPLLTGLQWDEMMHVMSFLTLSSYAHLRRTSKVFCDEFPQGFRVTSLLRDILWNSPESSRVAFFMKYVGICAFTVRPAYLTDRLHLIPADVRLCCPLSFHASNAEDTCTETIDALIDMLPGDATREYLTQAALYMLPRLHADNLGTTKMEVVIDMLRRKTRPTWPAVGKAVEAVHYARVFDLVTCKKGELVSRTRCYTCYPGNPCTSCNVHVAWESLPIVDGERVLVRELGGQLCTYCQLRKVRNFVNAYYQHARLVRSSFPSLLKSFVTVKQDELGLQRTYTPQGFGCIYIGEVHAEADDVYEVLRNDQTVWMVDRGCVVSYRQDPGDLSDAIVRRAFPHTDDQARVWATRKQIMANKDRPAEDNQTMLAMLATISNARVSTLSKVRM